VTNTNPVVADSSGQFSAIYLGDPPTFTAYKAILKTSDDVTVWTTDPYAGAPITTPIAASTLRSYLAGLQKTANTATTIGYGAGVCVDDTNSNILSLTAGAINCATVGADGLDAASLSANTWYHAFAIGKTDGTVARLASASPSSPTMPSGYTLKRRIGSFRANVSAQIANFRQLGDDFTWSATVSTYAGNFTATAVVAIPMTVPTGVKVMAKFRATADAGTAGSALFYSPEQATQAQNVPPGNASLAWSVANGVQAGDFAIPTDTSGQINGVGTAAGENVRIATYGWVDRRGRDD
jgi:hypothetical protein